MGKTNSKIEKFGYVKIKVDDVIKNSGISKNKLYQKSETQKKQIKNYRTGAIQRCDLYVLSRLCSVLKCSISDILEYVPGSKFKEED